MDDRTLHDATVRVDEQMSVRVRAYKGYATLIEVNLDTTSGLNAAVLLSPEDAMKLSKELAAAVHALPTT